MKLRQALLGGGKLGFAAVSVVDQIFERLGPNRQVRDLMEGPLRLAKEALSFLGQTLTLGALAGDARDFLQFRFINDEAFGAFLKIRA